MGLVAQRLADVRAGPDIPSLKKSIRSYGILYILCFGDWLFNRYVITTIFALQMPEMHYKKKKYGYLQESIESIDGAFKKPVEKIPKSARDATWSPPPPSAIKINCDGAFNSSRSLAAFGIIARDCGGKAQIWCVGRVVVSSTVSVEAWALRVACSTAMEMNYPRVIFESDCQELISCINDSKRSCSWEISSVVEDIKAWAQSFIWCNREKNHAAHWLASSCLVVKAVAIPDSAVELPQLQKRRRLCWMKLDLFLSHCRRWLCGPTRN